MRQDALGKNCRSHRIYTQKWVSTLLKIGICDDQKEWVDRLRCQLEQYLGRKHLAANITVFSSAEELLQGDWKAIQILLLDVVMGRQDGIQAAIQIRRKNPDVSMIFVSAYLDYATMGYQAKASAYLLKDQLATTFDSAMDAVLMERKLNQGVMEITVNGHVVPLRLSHIQYIESRGRTSIFYGQTECRTYMGISDVEAALAGKGFLRIHRCYIVNMAHCIALKNYRAILDNGKTLPCSQRDYSNSLQRLMMWKGVNQ